MKGFIVLLIFLVSQSIAASTLMLGGIVSRSIDIQVDERLHFLSNSNDLSVETQNSSGQTKRLYLQYNKKISINNTNIKKVTIYAP